MLETRETLHWPKLARAYGEAERALGHLAFALESTPLHATWLWREITRVAVLIVQAGGYQTDVEQLRRALIGAPIERDDNGPGLAAAKRVFLAAGPLFRQYRQTDSIHAFWPGFWASNGEASPPDDAVTSQNRAGEGRQPWHEDDDRPRLIGLVRELAGFADDGRRPALINLFVDLRRKAGTRRLPPSLFRLALPLALIEAGLLPRAAPGLLGGRRLALGMSAASPEAKPLSNWLEAGLDDLAREADQSRRRLIDLTRQHRAWHGVLAGAGLRRHARAPAALDLLAATPVLSIGLAAAHLGCSHAAAGKVMEKLVALGVLIPATSRCRHKIFVAGDLPLTRLDQVDPDQPLRSSEPAPLVDVDALSATLDGLFADLERLNERAQGRVRAGG